MTMKCAIMSLEAKQAENGNWYVNILAQPEGDPFAEELKYRMWCSETLANKLAANAPETIELQKVRVEVTPYQKVSQRMYSLVCLLYADSSRAST